MLIDCDIHIGYETLRDLVPFLDGATAEIVEQSGTNGLGMPSYPGITRPAGYGATPTTGPLRPPGCNSSARRSNACAQWCSTPSR
ncbi:MAG: hypothetical protein JOZ64_10765 [Solirubrobacterales bacterium]|nr:hypothetical protein [Solirubrobacterales bacterium]